MADSAFSGGRRIQNKLVEINDNLGTSREHYKLRVGFLENATYNDGTQVAYIAAIQNWGATIKRAPGTVTVYRSVNKRGTGFLRKGRFVKKAKANFVTTHDHGAYTIIIPPRPFFTNMIAKGKPHWASDLAGFLKQTQFNAEKSLKKMGEQIKGELQFSILETNSPPLAASTIRRKGFAKPLIDTGHMWNSVDYAVGISVPVIGAQPLGAIS